MSRIFTSGKLLLPLVTCSVAFEYPALPSDLTTPTQQRIAFYGPNAVAVGWNTYTQLDESCVQYGTSVDALDSKACSSHSTTYASSRTFFNSVVLDGLTSQITYYYKIVSTNSSVQHFTSPRVPGDMTPFNISVVADLGVLGADGYTVEKKDTIPSVEPALEHATIGCLAQTVNEYEFVIHPGDFAYADDWYLRPQNLGNGKQAYESILEQFYNQLAPIAGRKPYMAGPGNHDSDCTEIPYTSGLCPGSQKNFTDYLQRFGLVLPYSYHSSSSNITAQRLAETARSLSNPPFWYSFEYGMVHVIMLDTETDFVNAPDGLDGSAGLESGPFGLPGQQLAFISADLASVDRTVTPWIIVAGHRPWYTTGTPDDVCTACQEAFEDLIYTYGADVGVFGHVHNSARFAPIYNDTPDSNNLDNPKAPLYIIAGGAGNIEGLDSDAVRPPYTAFAYSDDYSYATMRFLDQHHLQIDFIRSSTGEVLDSSVLYKEHSESFVVQ